MKRLITVFVIFVYSVPVSLYFGVLKVFNSDVNNAADISIFDAFAIPLILMAIVGLLVTANIIGAVISVKKSQTVSFRTVMVYKLCLIPFYIVNFAVWLIGSLVFHTAILVLPMLPFVIAYTYLTMLGTSVHIIARLLDLRRSDMITTKQFVMNGILQFIFTIDVVDCIYLAAKQNKLNKQT